ncbi:MAG: hydroxymethylbilane synthase [Dehalococcoidia bacterium]|jgi:hydroxymethylbilane synthase
MRDRIIAGSRRSKLALIQTASVISRIRAINLNLEVSVREIVTSGDRDRHTQLDRLGTAVFVKELEEALLRREIDIAVHSLKDLPTEFPEGLRLIAVSERDDPRDALVAKAPLKQLDPGSRIGTGSLRRSIQLRMQRPDLVICPIRGNVDTRLRKVTSGEADGFIVAAAAMLRLGWQDKITEYLPVNDFLPAAGQGALAVEGRLEDKELFDLISPLNHLPTWQCITSERAFLQELGGGCRAPIAALATIEGGELNLNGMIAGKDGSKVLRGSAKGKPDSAEETGIRLARKLFSMGADLMIKEAKGC